MVCGAGFPVLSFLYGKMLNALAVAPEQYPEMRHRINFYAGMFIVLAAVEYLAFCVKICTLMYHSERLVRNIRALGFRSLCAWTFPFLTKTTTRPVL